MKRSALLATTLAFIFGLAAVAADKAAPPMDPKMQEMMRKFEEAATPGEPHKILSAVAGNWKTVSQMWGSPQAKPETTKGTASFKMILGGRWLQQEFKGKAMGQPFQGFGLTGYDNIKQRYETHWMDSMSTNSMNSEGDYDASTKTFKDKGTASCPITPTKSQDVRTEWQIVSKNKMVFSMFGKGPMATGPDYKMMEIVYTR